MDDFRRVQFLGLMPYLYYEDATAALEWLARVFGFEERRRFIGPDGGVREAVMRAGDAVIMLASEDSACCDGERTPTMGARCIVYVDDVDAHHARAKAAGLDAAEPREQPCGSRAYCARDPGGNSWTFCEHRGFPRFRTRR